MKKTMPIYLVREHMDNKLMNQELFLSEQDARHRMNDMSKSAQNLFLALGEEITSRCLAGAHVTIKSGISDYCAQIVRITDKNDPLVKTVMQIAQEASDNSALNAQYWCSYMGILLPCPNCGKMPVVEKSHCDNHFAVSVRCSACSSMVQCNSKDTAFPLDAAFLQWNFGNVALTESDTVSEPDPMGTEKETQRQSA